MAYIDIETVFKRNIKDESFLLSKMKIDEERNFFVNSFYLLNELNAVYFIYIKDNPEEARNCFYKVAMTNAYCYEKLNQEIFSSVQFILYPLLSDNTDVINYSLSYKNRTPAIQTFNVYFGQAAQNVLEDNKEGLSENISGLVKRSKTGVFKYLRGAVSVFEGFLHEEIGKIEAGLVQIIESLPKSQQTEIVRDYMNIIASGLAKLAWRKEYKVNIESTLIPKSILPVQPLKSYTGYEYFEELNTLKTG